MSFLSTACWAGGLYIQEFGTPSTGVANAGAVAVGQDASAPSRILLAHLEQNVCNV